MAHNYQLDIKLRNLDVMFPKEFLAQLVSDDLHELRQAVRKLDSRIQAEQENAQKVPKRR